MIRSQALRDSARGERCTLNIAGFCDYGTDTTVLAHVPFFGGSGMGMKCSDLQTVYACGSCHDVLDRRKRVDWLSDVDLYFYAGRGIARTQLRMIERGLITVKGAKE